MANWLSIMDKCGHPYNDLVSYKNTVQLQHQSVTLNSCAVATTGDHYQPKYQM